MTNNDSANDDIEKLRYKASNPDNTGDTSTPGKSKDEKNNGNTMRRGYVDEEDSGSLVRREEDIREEGVIIPKKGCYRKFLGYIHWIWLFGFCLVALFFVWQWIGKITCSLTIFPFLAKYMGSTCDKISADEPSLYLLLICCVVLGSSGLINSFSAIMKALRHD